MKVTFEALSIQPFNPNTEINSLLRFANLFSYTSVFLVAHVLSQQTQFTLVDYNWQLFTRH